jgi:hypothetical protein
LLIKAIQIQDPGIGIYLTTKNKIAKSVGASKSISHSNFVKQSFPWEFNIGFVIPGAFFIANTANKVS